MRSLTLLLGVILLTGSAPDAAWSQIDVDGWFEDGQTWIVWEDNNAGSVSYEIFASETDLVAAGTVVGATRVGRLILPDWQANRLQLGNPTISFAVPDGSGGNLRLAPTQGVFAFTPREERDLYFAVVEEGTTAVVPANGTGPFSQLLEPVTAHLQDVRTTSQGQEMRVYAHWILGDSDHLAGRGDYPVMGSADFNGTSHVFAVTDPTSGPPSGDVPAVAAFHGGGGAWWGFTPDQAPELGVRLPDALLISLDGTVNTVAEGPIPTAWLGYRTDLDRFGPSLPYPVPDGTLIGAYTTVRVGWTLDWLLENEPIDENHLAIAGHSAGARGSGVISRYWPERFSAVTGFCPHLEPPPESPILGDADQNLDTTLGFGVADLFTRTNRLSSERDLPFTRLFIGRQDTVGIASWNEQQVEGYRSLDSTGHGYQLYWDERTHGLGSFSSSYWGPSSYHAARYLTQYDKRESYPAFFQADLDTATTEQDYDIGNGDPLNGTTWGTWSGYFDWDFDSVDESATHWTSVFWLNAMSPTVADNFPGGAARTHVAIRRPEFLIPDEGDPVSWELVLEDNGTLLQSGTVLAGAEGLVVVPGLIVLPDPGRVRLTVTLASSSAPESEVEELGGSRLISAYPNPFRSGTEVALRGPVGTGVSVDVIDVSGRVVRTLVPRDSPIDAERIHWNGRNDVDRPVAAGVYFIQLASPEGRQSLRVVRLH